MYDSVNYSNKMDPLLKLIDRRCTVEAALGAFWDWLTDRVRRIRRRAENDKT